MSLKYDFMACKETGFQHPACPVRCAESAVLWNTQGLWKGWGWGALLTSILLLFPHPKRHLSISWKLQHCGKNTEKKINTKLYHKSECCTPSRIRVNSIWLLGNYGLLSERRFDLSSSWFGSGLCPNLLKNSSVRTVKGRTIGFTVLFPLTVKCFDWKQLGSGAFFYYIHIQATELTPTGLSAAINVVGVLCLFSLQSNGTILPLGGIREYLNNSRKDHWNWDGLKQM